MKKLQKIYFLFFFCIFITHGQTDCVNIKEFKSIQEHADLLTYFFNQANSNTGKEKLEFERLFFCAFPKSFAKMKELFGYEKGKSAPLYDYPLGYNIIRKFETLNSIDKESYYNKYIDICLNGVWEADNIRAGFGFRTRILSDTNDACNILIKRTDKEIVSVFRFFYDGPHPKNNQDLYDELYKTLSNKDERLLMLLKFSFEKLKEENDDHQH